MSRSKTQRALQDSRGHKGGAVRPARPDSRRSEAPSLKATGSCLSLLIHVLMLLALCLETLVCLLEVNTLTTNYGLWFGLFAWILSLLLTVSNPACLLTFPLPCPLENLCYTLMFVLWSWTALWPWLLDCALIISGWTESIGILSYLSVWSCLFIAFLKRVYSLLITSQLLKTKELKFKLHLRLCSYFKPDSESAKSQANTTFKKYNLFAIR